MIATASPNTSAVLNLPKPVERTTIEGVAHSRAWHANMGAIQFCRVPDADEGQAAGLSHYRAANQAGLAKRVGTGWQSRKGW